MVGTNNIGVGLLQNVCKTRILFKTADLTCLPQTLLLLPRNAKGARVWLERLPDMVGIWVRTLVSAHGGVQLRDLLSGDSLGTDPVVAHITIC